jgi:tetratricopeptide (TPR) repeat protein
MALYQAALMAEPENYRAAHELGVLLAGAGQLEMARELLINSAVKSPQPIIWRNLAMLHNRMGQRQLAAQAQQQADALQQTSSTSKTPQVDWVDPVTFASTPTPGSDLTPPAAPAQTPANSSEAASAPTKPAANVARKRYSEWNPLNLRR